MSRLDSHQEPANQSDEWDDGELAGERSWLPNWLPTFVCGLAGAVWLVAFRLHRLDDDLALFLATAQVVIWIYAATIPHEIAHALMARVLCVTVIEIRFGSGPRLGSIRLFGIPCHVHLFVTGQNYMRDEFRNRHWFRLRSWLIVAAGPVMNLLLAVAGIAIGGWSNFDFFPEEGYAIVQALVVGNLVAVLLALWPWTYYEDSEQYPTDGLQLLTIPWMTDREVEQAVENKD